jgi:hypothetical protein
MPDKPIAAKLLIKPNHALAKVNAPPSFAQTIGALPDSVTVAHDLDGRYDIVLLFAHHKADLDAYTHAATAAVKPGGILWVAYPKKSGSIQTDISRDVGWEAMARLDWHGVTQISLDDTWSALRFRPRADIKTMTRKF